MDQGEKKPSPVARDLGPKSSEDRPEEYFAVTGAGRILPGVVLGGKYQILGLIGRGGMGSVYEAREIDFQIDRTVAVKVLTPEVLSGDKSLERRFQEEIKIAAHMDHPNIVPIYNVGRFGSAHFFVMKYIQGKTFKQFLGDKNPVSEKTIRDLGAQTAAALAHIHKSGAIHRDVKSNNIMVDDDGHVTLMDFGLAKRRDATTMLTAKGEVLGTGPYLSPEQWRGKLDQRSDIYALGVVLYEMATGRLPFDSDNIPELINAILNKAETPIEKSRKDIGKDLCEIIHRCLAKRPEERFQTMKTLRRTLLGEIPLPALPRDDGEKADLEESPSIGQGNGDPTMALKRLEEAKKGDPNAPEIAGLEEDYQRLVHEEERALAEIRELVDVREHIRALDVAKTFLSRYHSRRVENDLRRVQAFLDKTEELLAEAELLRRKNKLSFAKPLYERVLARDPKNTSAEEAVEKLREVKGRSRRRPLPSVLGKLPGKAIKLFLFFAVILIFLPKISPPLAVRAYEFMGDGAAKAGFLSRPAFINAYACYERCKKLSGEAPRFAQKQNAVIRAMIDEGDKEMEKERYRLALDKYRRVTELRPKNKSALAGIEKATELLKSSQPG